MLQQVTVIDQTQRSSRSASSNLSTGFTPHITLEIPNSNYGSFLSPIREVATPLPSPSHTPNASLKRQSNLSSSDSPTQRRCKRTVDETSSDDSHRSSSSMPSTGWDSDRTVQQMPISIVVTPSVEARSPTRSNRPPPLQIVNSNFARFELPSDSSVDGAATSIAAAAAAAATAGPTPPPPLPSCVPVVCVSEPSPEQDGEVLVDSALDQTNCPSQCQKSVLKWKNVSIGSPPIRQLADANGAAGVSTGVLVTAASSSFSPGQGLRRGLKESYQDKSCSLDLPVAPPMITITANFSEVESDTDAGLLGKYTFRTRTAQTCSTVCLFLFLISNRFLIKKKLIIDTN